MGKSKAIHVDEEVFNWLKENLDYAKTMNNKIRMLIGLPEKKTNRGKYPWNKMELDRPYIFDFEKLGWDVMQVHYAMKNWNQRNKPYRIKAGVYGRDGRYTLTKVKDPQ